MKYFTLDSWIADQDLEAVDVNDIKRRRQGYSDYLAGIFDKLPLDLVRLNETVILGDAHLHQLNVDVSYAKVTLVVLAEDMTTREDRKVALEYGKVRGLKSVSDPYKSLSGPGGFGDLGNDEIELLDDGCLEHRFLFSSGIEIAIQFRDFTLTDLRD